MDDKATAIREARRELRARGEVDSMNRVMGMVHSSKRTVRKYWSETAPEENGVQTPAPVDPPTPAPVTDEAFRASFTAYVEAAKAWLATQGLMGNADVFACTKTHRWATPRPTVYALSLTHPLVEELEDELERTYLAHLALWEQVQAAQAPPPPAPMPEPEPEPEPAPFDRDNLRKYYFDRARTPWPDGTGLPAEQAVYDILRQLHADADALEVKTGRARYDVLNALGQSGGVADETPLKLAEDRWSAARFHAHRIKADMDRLMEQASYEGKTLAT